MVWWSDQLRELWHFEFTISYESNIADSRKRKIHKYIDLLDAAREAGFRSELITVEVGSRGMIRPSDLEPLASALPSQQKHISILIKQLCWLRSGSGAPETRQAEILLHLYYVVCFVCSESGHIEHSMIVTCFGS